MWFVLFAAVALAVVAVALFTVAMDRDGLLAATAAVLLAVIVVLVIWRAVTLGGQR